MSQSKYSKRRWANRKEPAESSSASDSDDSSPATKQQSKNEGPSPNRADFKMAATPGTKLAQEIHDEFLVCKICLEGYKSPKSLNCLHTFCENCIENHVMSESTYKKYTDYREFTCPLCRKRTQLPIGGVKKLPDNFLVSSLSEVVTRGRPSKFPFCDICKMVNRKHREAQSKCLDCAKLLCSSCVEMHKDTKVTSNHSIFDVEIEKDIECREHQDEVVRFYCEPCETCICVLCTFNEHKDHDITQFGDAVVKYKENIQSLLNNCKEKIGKADTQIGTLTKCEDIVKGVEKQVHDTAIHLIQEVRNREKVLIEEVQNLYGKEVMDMIDNKKDLCTQVESLRSTCNLTEVILKGKDIELLLLKKDVQDKLSTLNSISIKPPPSTVTKVINYVPGSVDMGFIQDLDRPLLTKMRLPRTGSNAEMGEIIRLDHKLTQTDEKGRAKDGKEQVSGAESDEDDAEEEESSEDDSSEEESDDEKHELKDSGVQTEEHQSDSSTESEAEETLPEMADQGTMTDEIIMEEKGVNTRSRSLQNQPTATTRHSPIKEGEDNSLAARRRRRRERALTTQVAGYNVDSSDTANDDKGLSYAERRKRRSGNMNNFSLDAADEVFYDAENRQGVGKRV